MQAERVQTPSSAITCRRDDDAVGCAASLFHPSAAEAPAQRRAGSIGRARRVVAGDRAALARATTLVESSAATAPRRRPCCARSPIQRRAPRAAAARAPPPPPPPRLGVAGPPGAGKSTLTRTPGRPAQTTSTRSASRSWRSTRARRGRALDPRRQTRMATLAASARALVRPAPARGESRAGRATPAAPPAARCRGDEAEAPVSLLAGTRSTARRSRPWASTCAFPARARARRAIFRGARRRRPPLSFSHLGDAPPPRARRRPPRPSASASPSSHDRVCDLVLLVLPPPAATAAGRVQEERRAARAARAPPSEPLLCEGGARALSAPSPPAPSQARRRASSRSPTSSPRNKADGEPSPPRAAPPSARGGSRRAARRTRSAAARADRLGARRRGRRRALAEDLGVPSAAPTRARGDDGRRRRGWRAASARRPSTGCGPRCGSRRPSACARTTARSERARAARRRRAGRRAAHDARRGPRARCSPSSSPRESRRPPAERPLCVTFPPSPNRPFFAGPAAAPACLHRVELPCRRAALRCPCWRSSNALRALWARGRQVRHLLLVADDVLAAHERAAHLGRRRRVGRLGALRTKPPMPFARTASWP